MENALTILPIGIVAMVWLAVGIYFCKKEHIGQKIRDRLQEFFESLNRGI